MTYEEIVDLVREVYENADARQIYDHIAIQVDIVGEGGGVFYIEVAERQICVEPYDYFDRDILITTDGETILGFIEGRVGSQEAVDSGRFRIAGDMKKFEQMRKVTKVKRKRKTVKKQ